MRNVWRSALPLSLLVACGRDHDGASDALSREDAADAVIAELVTAGDPIVVLGMQDPIAAGDRIVAYHPLAEMAPEVAITAAGESWFFWLDDEPGAQFDHPSRYAMVDRASGEITVIDARWWPTKGGAIVWDDEAYASDADRVHVELDDGTMRRGLVPELSPIADCNTGGTGHAVVINGWKTGESGRKDFDNDGANMNDAFTDAGLDTTYFGPAGSEGVDQPYGRSAVDQFFAQKASELQAGDTLVVFVGGHGWVNDTIDYKKGETQIGDVWESDLEGWLAGFDPGVNVVVIINGCHSGGMLDSLSCTADLAIAATDEASSSYGDFDWDGDANPQDNGSEWTSSVLTCWNTFMEDENTRTGVSDRAAAAGQSFFTELVGECFTGASEWDDAQKRGYTHPLQQAGAAKTSVPQEDPQPPMCDPGDPPTGCSDPAAQEFVEEVAGVLDFDSIFDWACTNAKILERGNTTLHSDGQKTATADGDVDLVALLGPFVIDDAQLCAPDTSGCVFGPSGQVADEMSVAVVKLSSPLPVVPEQYYQYGFVFDVDGETGNNYHAAEPYPADFFDDTDLWIQLRGAPGVGWSLEVLDASDGAFTPIVVDAVVRIDEDRAYLSLPTNLLTSVSEVRFTAFRHSGDYGLSDPWSGDVVPPVGEPLLPLPPPP
ncbi:MAG TPA: hypothetical protein VG755_20570 [Nannocystaceae bacterium]|nr:hypothetical protein [Nannocystaceae bacterium]